MNIQTRLYRLENQIGSEPSKGLPVRPNGLTDEQYELAVTNKRKELGLTPNQIIPIMALCGSSELPE